MRARCRPCTRPCTLTLGSTTREAEREGLARTLPCVRVVSPSPSLAHCARGLSSWLRADACAQSVRFDSDLEALRRRCAVLRDRAPRARAVCTAAAAAAASQDTPAPSRGVGCGEANAAAARPLMLLRGHRCCCAAIDAASWPRLHEGCGILSYEVLAVAQIGYI